MTIETNFYILLWYVCTDFLNDSMCTRRGFMLKVSVLIPVYNTDEVYLKEAIASILNQTFQDFELIIVDDGSKNDIETIVKSFHDSRIKFYKNETNKGVAYTRNRLMDLAQSEYIAFQDSDDISLPNRLEKQVKFLDENPNFSIVGCWEEKFPKTKIYRFLPKPKILDFLIGCAVQQGASMMRINDIKKYNLKYNEEYKTSEDYDFWCRAVKDIDIYNIQEVLYKYRLNPTSLVHTQNKLGNQIDIKIRQNLLEELTEDKVLQEKIMYTISEYSRKKTSFLEKIFSVRDELFGIKKCKIIYILGLKLRI